MSVNIHDHRILILDFGSQYTQLIARRVREIGVYCELHAYDMQESDIEAFAPDGIILSGGPETVTLESTPRAPDCVFELGCPVLGICYGMQTMATQLGGNVESHEHREFGFAQLKIHGHSTLFEGIEDHVNDDGIALLDVWMSHGDRVVEMPPGFSAIACSDYAPYAAMGSASKRFYGVQFHPEVTHTPQGTRILARFVKDICGCQSLWTPAHIIEEQVHALSQSIGNDTVLLGLSGGVDSSVVAALLHRAIGNQLVCVFVDNGLLRAGEVEQVRNTFEKSLNMQLEVVDASTQFYNALKGISDPEEKRKIVGREFIAVFEAEAKKHTDVKWLAQGTIYPDVIESAASKTNKAHVIKTHHNVGGLPDRLALKLIEPLRELFKDEVRALGLALGLPSELIKRHPFPGPGLSVRILGEVKPEYVELLRKADAIFIEELRRHKLYDTVSQAFAVFLPVRTVGVMGDARRYEYVIALRSVDTVDFMTACWSHLPYEFLATVSHRIINEVSGIARVVYDVSGKPPATIEWE